MVSDCFIVVFVIVISGSENKSHCGGNTALQINPSMIVGRT